MHSSPRGSRTKQPLSELLMTRVNAYALAAGAAGVAVIALGQPSDAEIVFTPANAAVPRNERLSLDLNHDGTPDFGFFFYGFAYHSFNATINANPLSGGGVIMAGPGAGYAAPLARGFGIGPGRNFAVGGSRRMERTHGFDYEGPYYRRAYGPWANQQNKYLGVEFFIGGELHYGWIRLTVTIVEDELMDATITGYAYETNANQSIHAGELSDEASVPAKTVPMVSPSLGALALGSLGLDLWRREDSSLSVL
ncbi:MAG: hypothetical protein ABSH02_19665 [Candidatus Sulfotelmatobacter sp.]|jgi:hypothetical protein